LLENFPPFPTKASCQGNSVDRNVFAGKNFVKRKVAIALIFTSVEAFQKVSVAEEECKTLPNRPKYKRNEDEIIGIINGKVQY